jgi:hypothetical protein
MNYIPYSPTDNYCEVNKNIVNESTSTNQGVESFVVNTTAPPPPDNTELHNFREKERLYNQKSTYQVERTYQLEQYKNILTVLFYILCIPFIYIIYGSSNNIYLKATYITLALTYPFYIFFIENIIYNGWIYIVALIRGVPTERL